MKVISIKGMEITVGLFWNVLSAEMSAAKAMAAATKQKNAKFGVPVRSGGIGVVGLVPQGQKCPKAPSGAALLAFANQEYEINRSESSSPSQSTEDANWVLVESVGNNQYWVVVIKEGLPMPGSDILEDRAGVMDVLGDVLDSPGFVVYCPDADLRMDIGQQWNAPNSEKGFLELIKGIKASQGALKQVAGIPPVAIALIAGLIVLGILGFGIQQMRQKAAAAARAAAAAASASKTQAEQAQAKSKYEKDVQDAVLKGLDDGVKQVNKSLFTPSPAQAIQGWQHIVRGLTLTDAGWKLANVNCTLENKVPTCVAHFTRGDYGINRTFMDAHPDAQFDGDKVSYTLTDSALLPRQTDWYALDDALKINHGLISDLQLLRNTGAQYHMEASKEITQSVTIPPPPATMFKPGATKPTAQAAPVIQMGVATGKVTFGGDGLWQLEGLGQMIDSPNITLSGMDVTVGDGAPSWSLKGDYFIHSKPQPELPTIPMPDNTFITVPLPAKYAAPRPASGGLGASEIQAPAIPAAPVGDGTAPAAGPLVPSPPPGPVAPPTGR